MIRRDILKGTLAIGTLLGASAGAMAARRIVGAPLRPLRISPDRIVELRCCLRPFRALGPRLDAEQIGDTLVIYNYGHGGSGWSLSWGSAEIAVEKAMSVLPKEIAVIGCGVIGLTTAVTAQQAGAKVTIYTKDLMQRTRSVRAGGFWTPDSRIALTEAAGPGFGAVWERMARRSYTTFRSMMGMAGNPVDINDQYSLSDIPGVDGEHRPPDPSITASYATAGLPQQSSEFGSYKDRIADITPAVEEVNRKDTPFKAKYVKKQQRMMFNFSSYNELMMERFYQAGGALEIRNFRSKADLMHISEKVVIICLGYASRDFFGDSSIIPVRGQNAVLLADPDAFYCMSYNGFSASAKRDSITIQNAGTLGPVANVGNSDELPNRDETLAAIDFLQKAFVS